MSSDQAPDPGGASLRSFPPPERPGSRLLPRLAISLVIAGLIWWMMRRGGMPVVPEREAFAHVKWWAVPLYVVLLTMVHWFRAWRWDYLLRPMARVPTRKIIAIAWIGFFAIMMLPLRMGEVVRPVLMRRTGKMSGSAAMGTIAAERVLDGLVVALLLAATLCFVPRLPLEGVTLAGFPVARTVTLGYLTVLLFVTALVVLAVFMASRGFAERATMKVVGLVSKGLARRLARMVGGLADGLRSLPDPKLMGPFMLQTLVYWGVNAVSMWLLGLGCGLPMSWPQGFAVMGVLAMGILLPAGPGLFGTFQVSVYLALRLYFPESVVLGAGGAYVFIMYATQFVFHTVAGMVPLWLERIDPRDAMGDGGPEDPRR